MGGSSSTTPSIAAASLRQALIGGPVLGMGAAAAAVMRPSLASPAMGVAAVPPVAAVMPPSAGLLLPGMRTSHLQSLAGAGGVPDPHSILHSYLAQLAQQQAAEAVAAAAANATAHGTPAEASTGDAMAVDMPAAPAATLSGVAAAALQQQQTCEPAAQAGFSATAAEAVSAPAQQQVRTHNQTAGEGHSAATQQLEQHQTQRRRQQEQKLSRDQLPQVQQAANSFSANTVVSSHTAAAGSFLGNVGASARMSISGASVASSAQSAAKRPRASSLSVQLNKQIMRCESVDELLGVVRSRGSSMDYFNISSAIARMPKLVSSGAAPSYGNAPPRGLQHPSVGGAYPMQPHQQAQQVQGQVAGGHHQQLDAPSRALADCLAGLMAQHVRAFDARGLANSAWAFAKIRYMPNAALPALIADEALVRIDAFSAQNLSNLAWAFVYMHHRDERLLDLMAKKVRSVVNEFKPQELANVLWAFASLEHYDPAMVAAVGSRAAQIAGQFKEQELSNTIWALGRMGYPDRRVLRPLLAEARAKLDSFQPQGVANIAWALGALGHRDDELMAGVVHHCARTGLAAFDSQALSNLAWACSKLEYRDMGFLSALVAECGQRLERLSPLNLANVLCACAALGHRDERMLAAWARQVMARLGSIEPQVVANLAWAFARLGHTDAQLFEALAGALHGRTGALTSPQCLANATWAFALVEGPSGASGSANASAGKVGELLKELGRAALPRLSTFNAQQRQVIAAAFSEAGPVAGPPLQQQKARAAEQARASGDGAQAPVVPQQRPAHGSYGLPPHGVPPPPPPPRRAAYPQPHSQAPNTLAAAPQPAAQPQRPRPHHAPRSSDGSSCSVTPPMAPAAAAAASILGVSYAALEPAAREASTPSHWYLPSDLLGSMDVADAAATPPAPPAAQPAGAAPSATAGATAAWASNTAAATPASLLQQQAQLPWLAPHLWSSLAQQQEQAQGVELPSNEVWEEAMGMASLASSLGSQYSQPRTLGWR